MALVYKSCIPAGGLPAYVCDPCSEGEKGRVSGVFFAKDLIKDDLTAANLGMLTWWETQLAAGSIIIIPSVRGTYDGGAQNKVTGFGRTKEKVTGKTHTLVFNDKNHTGNKSFYEYIENNLKGFILGWVTNNELRVANNTLDSFEAKDPVEEDIESLVLWQGTAVWIQHQKNGGIPLIVDLSEADEVKELFDNCIDPNPAP